MKKSVVTYKNLINEILPATYQTPVQFNHWFNRIILDWLFQDCWYNYLDKRKTAISQLTESQLQLAIQRMNKWLLNHEKLVEDNNKSLQYRSKQYNIIQPKQFAESTKRE